jgi:hypothetical protein
MILAGTEKQNKHKVVDGCVIAASIIDIVADHQSIQISYGWK